MKMLLNSLLVGLFLLSAGRSDFAVGANGPAAKRPFFQAVSSNPTITYAEWMGKNLIVQGINFADGATVFVDGQILKSSNHESYPSSLLVAKKARKKVAADQVIRLQVRNPDGEASNEFTFYSGFVITESYTGSWIHLKLGERFLLYLPPGGEPPTLGWGFLISGADPTILTHIADDLPIPRAQGFLRAGGPGQVFLEAQGARLCLPPPAQCTPSGFMAHFYLNVVIDADHFAPQSSER